jgi:hypothetical protein
VTPGFKTNDRYATLSVGTSVREWCHCEGRSGAAWLEDRVLSIRTKESVLDFVGVFQQIIIL